MAHSPRKTDASNGGLTGVTSNTVTIDIKDAGEAIKAARADVRLAARQLVAEAKRVGALLIAAQQIVPPNRWLEWSRFEAGLSQKAVRRFQAVARCNVSDATIAQDGLVLALTHCVDATKDEGGGDE